MKKSEMIQIIVLLAGNYETVANKTEKQRTMMLNAWYECLGDLDYQLVLQAVKKSIIDSPYPPTIHEIRKNAMELLNTEQPKTAIEAWNEAYRMICKGSYMTEEQFESASPIVKKFFGSLRQVRELAITDSYTVNTVTKGQFLKQYEVLLAREQEQKLLPQSIKEFSKTLSEKMDLKRIGVETNDNKNSAFMSLKEK